MKTLARYKELIGLGVVAVGVVLLRLPSLFEPQLYGDEGIYLTLGMGIRKGLVLYQDLYDNKPPGIYILAALASSVSWFRTILLVWNLLNVVVFYDLAKLLWEGRKKVAMAATGLFGILSTIPLFEGNIVNAEVLMILFTTTGWLWVVEGLSGKSGVRDGWRWWGAGVVWGLAGLLKMPALVDVGSVVLVVVMCGGGIAKMVRRIGAVGVGVGGVLVASWMWFAIQGAGGVYLKSAFWDLFSYLGSWGGKTSGVSPFVWRVIVLGAGVLGTWGVRKKLSKRAMVVWGWMGFSLFAALLSGRPYPHYLMQAVPALALVVSMFVWEKSWTKAVSGGLVGLLIVCFYLFRFWGYPILPYYADFVSYLDGRIDRGQYAEKFNSEAGEIAALAARVRQTTGRNEKIFVWGTEPNIYVLADRLPGSRYVVSYHIHEAKAYKSVAEELRRTNPKVIIVFENEEKVEELEEVLQEYVPMEERAGAIIYRRLGMERVLL